MLGYLKKKTADALKEIIDRHYENYTKAVEASRVEYVKSLPIETTITVRPLYGSFYRQEDHEAFKETCREAQEKAMSAFDGFRSTVKEKMTEAPTEDAVNTIKLLSLRTPTKEDLENLLDKYGDNYQVYCTIADIAKKNDVTIPKSPIARDVESLDYIENSTLEILGYHAAYEGLSPGKVAVYKMGLDDYLDQTDAPLWDQMMGAGGSF